MIVEKKGGKLFEGEKGSEFEEKGEAVVGGIVVVESAEEAGREPGRVEDRLVAAGVERGRCSDSRDGRRDRPARRDARRRSSGGRSAGCGRAIPRSSRSTWRCWESWGRKSLLGTVVVFVDQSADQSEQVEVA